MSVEQFPWTGGIHHFWWWIDSLMLPTRGYKIKSLRSVAMNPSLPNPKNWIWAPESSKSWTRIHYVSTPGSTNEIIQNLSRPLSSSSNLQAEEGGGFSPAYLHDDLDCFKDLQDLVGGVRFGKDPCTYTLGKSISFCLAFGLSLPPWGSARIASFRQT